MRSLPLVLSLLSLSTLVSAESTPGPHPTYIIIALPTAEAARAELPASALFPKPSPAPGLTPAPSGNAQPMTPVPTAQPATLPEPFTRASLPTEVPKVTVVPEAVPTTGSSAIEKVSYKKVRHGRAWREARRQRMLREVKEAAE